MTATPNFASALSTSDDPLTAIEEVCQKVHAELKEHPSFVVLFFSADWNSHAESFAAAIKDKLNPIYVIGCCGESIIGTRREVENEPAVTMLAGTLPGDSLRTIHLEFERSSDGSAIVGWPDGFDDRLSTDANLIVLADPFSFPTDMLLERMNEDWPGLVISGGVASGCPSPGDSRLIMNDTVLKEGAVALYIGGAINHSTVVSQGCRPIGEPMIVTEVEQNEIIQLGGRPALLQLKEMFDKLPTRDQQQVQNGVHIGRVVNEYQDEFEQGDFLIRNVMGIDPDTGKIAVADYFRVGQTVQFHIRDEASADGEMKQLLAASSNKNSPAAGLLFSCNGRGSRMFSTPDHDAALIDDKLGEIPLAGFFAAGEIGPIGGKNYLHGFTASLYLFNS